MNKNNVNSVIKLLSEFKDLTAVSQLSKLKIARAQKEFFTLAGILTASVYAVVISNLAFNYLAGWYVLALSGLVFSYLYKLSTSIPWGPISATTDADLNDKLTRRRD
jgi:hypothetical protein